MGFVTVLYAQFGAFCVQRHVTHSIVVLACTATLVWICLARLIAFDRCPLGLPCLSV